MRKFFRFLSALAIALLVVAAFRALVLTVYTVEGSALLPEYQQGDRILVNRWSYGLRTGGKNLFKYERMIKRNVCRGDIVAFNNPLDSFRPVRRREVFICRCKALPGDSVSVIGAVPAGHYLMQSINNDNSYYMLVPEDHIIGRAVMTLYNYDSTIKFYLFRTCAMVSETLSL